MQSASGIGVTLGSNVNYLVREWDEAIARADAGYSIRVPERYKAGTIYDAKLTDSGCWRIVERSHWGQNTPTLGESLPYLRFSAWIGMLPLRIVVGTSQGVSGVGTFGAGFITKSAANAGVEKGLKELED